MSSTIPAMFIDKKQDYMWLWVFMMSYYNFSIYSSTNDILLFTINNKLKDY